MKGEVVVEEMQMLLTVLQFAGAPCMAVPSLLHFLKRLVWVSLRV